VLTCSAKTPWDEHARLPARSEKAFSATLTHKLAGGIVLVLLVQLAGWAVYRHTVAAMHRGGDRNYSRARLLDESSGSAS
jgi:hypothetical protein